MLTREVTQLNRVVSLPLEAAHVWYTQTGGQARLEPPVPLCHPWSWQTRSQVTCNPRTAIIGVCLSISPWPVCFFSDSKCPELLWSPPPAPPQFTVCLKVHRNQTPTLLSEKADGMVFPLFFLQTLASPLQVFFSLSPSAFNFLFSLTSVFSAFFHSLLFSLCFPRPFLCFWFLVTYSPDSFLCRNHYLCPASFQSFWSLFHFLHPFPSCSHFFPNHPLTPPRTFEVSLCHAMYRRQEHSVILSAWQLWKWSSFPHFALGQTSVYVQGSNGEHLQFSVTNHYYSFSVVHSAFLGYLLCVRPCGGKQCWLRYEF